MKKVLLTSILLLSVVAVFATTVQKTQEDYKQELKDKGFLYGCTPANWSLIEPVRGGFNWAAIHGNLEIMQLEKNAGLDITSCGKALPTILIQKNKIDAFKFLFDNGYNPNGIGLSMSYLDYAIYMKRVDFVKVLVDAGAKADKKTEHYLKKCKKQEIIDLLKQ